jgi:hypothetical protein
MSVTLYSEACANGVLGGYESVMNYSPSEPYFWDSMIVATSNTDGLPLVVNFYNGDKLAFVRTWTYDSDGNVTSLTIS